MVGGDRFWKEMPWFWTRQWWLVDGLRSRSRVVSDRGLGGVRVRFWQ